MDFPPVVNDNDPVPAQRAEPRLIFDSKIYGPKTSSPHAVA